MIFMANRNPSHRRLTVLACMLAAVALPSPAAAQLDPLLFLKLAAPNVIVAVDTANRMQRNAPTDPASPQTSTSYYDPYIYQASLISATIQAELGLPPGTTTYRRKYVGLNYTNNASGDKISAATVVGVPNSDASYASFENVTRISVARAALDQAIKQNQ